MVDIPKKEKQFNPVEFKMKFRAVFALLAFVAAMGIIIVAMISKIAQESQFTGPIIGFITGSLVTLILSFYFGSSELQGDEPGTKPPILKEPRVLLAKTASNQVLSGNSKPQYDRNLTEMTNFPEGGQNGPEI